MECKSLRESGKEIKKFEVAYFTASICTEKEAKEFAESLKLDYPILADPEGEAAIEYGLATKEKPKFPKRHTIYIGKDGKILAIDKKVKFKTAGADIATKLKELKVDAAKEKQNEKKKEK